MLLRAFWEQETAAVTVDWVVLSAAAVAMGIGATNITRSGMETLVTNVRAELTNTDPGRNYFDELMNLSAFYDYDSFHSGYGSEWGVSGYDEDGRNWAQSAYDTYASMDNQQLLDQYMYDYEVLTAGDPFSDDTAAQAMDHIAVQEAILLDRGLGIPEGYYSAETLRTALDTGTDIGTQLAASY